MYIRTNIVPMYKLHFDYIKNKYGNQSRLLFTDTDSLIYEIEAKMFMTVLVTIEKCLMLVIIHLSQNIKMIQRH